MRTVGCDARLYGNCDPPVRPAIALSGTQLAPMTGDAGRTLMLLPLHMLNGPLQTRHLASLSASPSYFPFEGRDELVSCRPPRAALWIAALGAPTRPNVLHLCSPNRTMLSICGRTKVPTALEPTKLSAHGHVGLAADMGSSRGTSISWGCCVGDEVCGRDVSINSTFTALTQSLSCIWLRTKH
jgi:hypothetical protein